MDIEEEMNEVMKDTICLIETRGKLYDAVDINKIQALCLLLDADLHDKKNDWLTPLGNLMGAVMYILDMHSGMSDYDRRIAANAVSASIITNSIQTEVEKINRTVN
jgi:hypothetical protein